MGVIWVRAGQKVVCAAQVSRCPAFAKHRAGWQFSCVPKALPSSFSRSEARPPPRSARRQRRRQRAQARACALHLPLLCRSGRVTSRPLQAPALPPRLWQPTQVLPRPRRDCRVRGGWCRGILRVGTLQDWYIPGEGALHKTDHTQSLHSDRPHSVPPTSPHGPHCAPLPLCAAAAGASA